jgi:hypothetical protein
VEMPFSVKVDLGLAELISKLDGINQRRRGRQEQFFLDLYDDLDATHTIVTALDNAFVDLATGFADTAVIGDRETLTAHVKATQKYLSRRKTKNASEPSMPTPLSH